MPELASHCPLARASCCSTKTSICLLPYGKTPGSEPEVIAPLLTLDELQDGARRMRHGTAAKPRWQESVPPERPGGDEPGFDLDRPAIQRGAGRDRVDGRTIVGGDRPSATRLFRDRASGVERLRQWRSPKPRPCCIAFYRPCTVS